MNTINFTNNMQTNSLNPEVKKRFEDKESFTAIDKEKLKQDVAEFQEKTEEHVKENFFSRTLKNLGIKDPKKFFISLGATLATVVGLAFFGNKSSDKMARLGIRVDEFLKSKSWFNSITNFFSKGKSNLVGFLRRKSKTIDNIATTLKNRPAKPRCDFTRGYGRGFVSIFSLTPVDILKNTISSLGDDKAQNALKNLVGDDRWKEFFDEIKKGVADNRAFCTKLTEAIKNKHGLTTKGELLEFFVGLEKGSYNGIDFSEFTNIKMKDKGKMAVISSWWPVNIIDSIGSKIFKGKWKGFCRGNLGDSLIKFNVVNGSLADTKIGSLVQKSITVPTESISNFVNDKSGLGAFLCSSIMALYNNVQDAPKEKKVATIADDYIGTMGSIAISTPLAFATTYGLASLKNLDSKKGIFAKPLRLIGKFFGMGLNEYDAAGRAVGATNNKFLRGAGGALRFALIMFIFSPFFAKPIKKIVNKIFGKPYNASEAAQEKQLQEQRNTLIPELGITQGELEEKIKANPQALAKIQSDPMLLREIQANPKLILDILDGKEVKTKQKDKLVSPANLNLINNSKRNLFSSGGAIKEENEASEQIQDTATYIPSSEFTANPSSLSEAQTQEYKQIMQESDKVLKEAEKYI